MNSNIVSTLITPNINLWLQKKIYVRSTIVLSYFFHVHKYWWVLGTPILHNFAFYYWICITWIWRILLDTNTAVMYSCWMHDRKSCTEIFNSAMDEHNDNLGIHLGFCHLGKCRKWSDCFASGQIQAIWPKIVLSLICSLYFLHDLSSWIDKHKLQQNKN